MKKQKKTQDVVGEVGKTEDDGEKKQQIWREVQPTVVFSFFLVLLSLFLLNRASSCPTKIRISLKSPRPPGARLIANPIKYDGHFANREGSAEDFTHSAEIIMEFREMIYIA